MIDKLKLFVSSAFLLLTAGLLIYGNINRQKSSVQVGMFNIEESSVIIEELLNDWRQLPSANEDSKKEIFEKQVIVAFVFSISDCGVCLARVDELTTYVHSIIQGKDIGLVCIGIAKSPEYLDRFLSVSLKPCEVLIKIGNPRIKSTYGSTPLLIILHKSGNSKIIKSKIGPQIITSEYKKNLNSPCIFR